MLTLPFLYKVKFLKFDFPNAENGLVSRLTDVFSQPFSTICTMRHHTNSFIVFGANIKTSVFRSFFNALFSLPKLQLAECSLEIRENGSFDCLLSKELAESWSVNSSPSNKLRKLIYLVHPATETDVCEGRPILKFIRNIANYSNVYFVL